MRLMVLAISNKFRLFSGILLALILCQSTLQAQITAPLSSYSSTTAYSVGKQDDIFVFCDEAGVGAGELKAVSPDGTSGWDFTWTKWDSGTNTYGGTFPINNGQESILSDLSDGFYRVILEKGGETSQVYQAWVINHLKSMIQPSLTKTLMDCVGVHFTSSYIATTYQYNNYPSSDLLDLITTAIFSFKRGGVELQYVTVPDYDGSEKSFIDDDSFEGDSEYEITVIDECGFEYTSNQVISNTYVVDATFTFDPSSGEAPLEVTFDTDDPNATSFQWFFYQDKDRLDDPISTRDSLLADVMTGENEIYTYLHPGSYFVKLIAINNDDSMNCVDIFTSTEIKVGESLFEVPNVFTPNGDGVNDEFHVKLYSVKSYSVKIFNRWGRLVSEFHESDVSPGNEVDGTKSSKSWNGKINGKLASPGTYFYVIEAEGREEEGKHYTERGSLTLLHNK
ncbi:gliding motility-associated C-terminal domain-containing protein [Ancylomarina sp. 16SWW S1-10-2]|uniref:T9SS type B sorting domain-containing protein n=1 Tax=Ancylomarina sp. 16SWW S1-10-2 TaxID=2499681 RepID=UPI0012AD9D8B|nr:gliding motility-associated C-terminal domain-containing protein [Ancylomarina sp. 16SWW S1-10-2]MRT91496.1 T9SS type B sorting domain-containing protein [Ancylomarina sp. 16SWW S1-10-2]